MLKTGSSWPPNNVSAEKIYHDYLVAQKRIFLTSLNERADIDLLLSLIPTNVLRGKTLRRIAAEFKAQKGGLACYDHPFCELFNNGLLGSVESDPSNPNELIQKFQRPHEFNWRMHSMIVDQKIYLLHPSLQGMIRNLRPNQFHVNTANVIGHGRPWVNNGKHVYPLIFASHAHVDQPGIVGYLTELERRLEKTVPCDIWLDTDSIPKGEVITKEVEKGVADSDLVLFFVSYRSLKSGWVETEWRTKLGAEIARKQLMVICCIIDGTSAESLPEFLKQKSAVMLCGNDPDLIDKELERLVRDISSELIGRRNRRL